MNATCPHCSAANQASARFCESCGKAMPGAAAGPRVIGAKEFATSGAGRDLQLQQLAKQARSVTVTLFALSGLQFLGCVIFAAIWSTSRAGSQAKATALVISMTVGIIAVIFTALAAWSRRNPLPAAIVGLVLLISLWTIDVISNPATAAQGWIIKVAIIAALARAIQAGMKHRALKRELDGDGQPAFA